VGFEKKNVILFRVVNNHDLKIRYSRGIRMDGKVGGGKLFEET
jgi:hypothetical protein